MASSFHHLFWLVLFVIFLSYSQLSPTHENWVYWPGAHLLSQWALSWPIPLILNLTGRYTLVKRNLFYVSLAIAYAGCSYLLEGIVILTLERLLAYQEHIQLSSLWQYYQSNWYQSLRGIGWFVVMAFLHRLFKIQDQFDNEKRKNLEQSNELGSSTLAKLTLQLNPHLLFNSMNTIAMMVRRGENKSAVSVISKLNILLREVLYGNPEHTWSLKEEIKFTENLLEIEKMRFGEHIDVIASFPDLPQDIEIPKLLLQPLIENAFKHGLSLESKGIIDISIQIREKNLSFEIFNTGNSAMPKDYLSKSGIGLTNTMHRLKHFYQDRFTLKIEELNEGTKILLLIPYDPN